MKAKTCEQLGIYSRKLTVPGAVTTEQLLSEVKKLNEDDAIDGILVQLPLPKHVNKHAILEGVDPRKDVDGFHSHNLGSLLLGHETLVACTPLGVMELLQRSGVKIEGANAVVLGRSDIVGKPMALLLMHANATVTICHSATRDIGAHCRRADILIAAMGVAEFVKADMVKPGAVVVDVGVNRVSDPAAKNGSRLVGDVDFAAVQPIAGQITPNPGGVGPMTIAMLMQNTVRAAEGIN